MKLLNPPQTNLKPEDIKKVFRRISVSDQDLADKLSDITGRPLTQQAVNQWVQRATVPIGWVAIITQAYKRRVKAWELRPDVFPAPV